MEMQMANPTMTFEQLETIITRVVSDMLDNKLSKRSIPAAKGGGQGQDIDKLVVKAFARKGIMDAAPRKNIITYNRWLDLGFKVKPGEKSVAVKQFRLFHRSQVEPVYAEPATAEKLPKVSPVAETKAKSQAKAAKGVSDKIEAAKAKAIAPAKATAPKANVTPIRGGKGKDQPTLPL
jgi:hypothetical protein